MQSVRNEKREHQSRNEKVRRTAGSAVRRKNWQSRRTPSFPSQLDRTSSRGARAAQPALRHDAQASTQQRIAPCRTSHLSANRTIDGVARHVVRKGQDLAAAAVLRERLLADHLVREVVAG